ncbi:DEAD/DEAH box helicase [Clostridium perfringens]|nr:DEAD/DEAH box helicase [Clostridium perfringens]
MIIDREKLSEIDRLIEKYTIMEICREFLGEATNKQIDVSEIKFLLENAVILSSQTSSMKKIRALKIATIVAKLSMNKNYDRACLVILTKLRNFKTRELIELNSKIDLNNNDISLQNIEQRFCEALNSVTILGKKYLLNNFQVEFFNLVRTKKYVSVSAPTSSGKSFIMKRIIINLFFNGINDCVYIVPTRALISEVVNDFRKEIQEMDEKINIFTSSEINEISKKEKNLFVLTQERFYQLCNNNEVKIEYLIIDEAQNINNGTRGILLEYCIKYAKRLWKNLRVIFISPLINNPEAFNKKFFDETEGSMYINESSVRQNIIKFYTSSRGYDIYVNDKLVKEKYPINRSGTISKNIVNVIKKFNNNQMSIIYCDKPSITEKVCKELYNLDYLDDLNNKKLNEFADFIENIIDKKYYLGDFIRKGIAFHYGKLPQFIRLGIEELADEGLLRFIVCTSTLLQGVNIPAQNIYVYNPGDLNKLDFWNLLGRAGRMGNDLVGNIILIQNQSWSEIDMYDNKETALEFETESIKREKILNNISSENVEIDTLINSNVNEKEKEIVEMAIGSMLIDKINNETILEGENNDKIKILEDKLATVINELTVPTELLIKLIGIKYENIEKLWKLFNENSEIIEEYIIVHPLNDEFYSSFNKALKVINENIMDNRLYGTDYQRDRLTTISKKWITEDRISNILLFNVVKDDDSDKISKKIREQINTLNEDIRYKIVKGIYGYNEILKKYLETHGRIELLEKVVNIPLYLEFGACKKNTLDIISMGLNREFAIEITRNYHLNENDIVNDLKKLDLFKIKNNYIKYRIKEFIKNI